MSIQFYEKKFNWISIWYILNKIKCKQSIIQFQWKCLHHIVYSEYRLQKMGKSNGQCHFCKNEIESLIRVRTGHGILEKSWILFCKIKAFKSHGKLYFIKKSLNSHGKLLFEL